MPALAQTVGYIETFENEKIDLYARPDKKVNLSRMAKDCECEIESGNSLLYVNQEGKVKKIKRSNIKHLFLSAGNLLCKETSQQILGNTHKSTLGAETSQDLHYFGLPTKKKGKGIDIHSVLLESNDYMLTMHDNSSLGPKVYIYRISDEKLMSDPISFYTIGYGKDGKKAFLDLKKYFKDCTKFVNAIDDQFERNKKTKKMRRMPVLLNIQYNQCP